jgi:hypothetical protein
VPTRPAQALRSPPAASQRPVLAPWSRIHHPRLGITRHHRGFTGVRPSGLPRPVVPGWNRGPWASASSFTPRRYRRRMSKWGQAPGHWPEITPSASTDPPTDASTHRVDPRVARLPCHRRLWNPVGSVRRLPTHKDSHPLGCHRPRIPDRLVFDKLVDGSRIVIRAAMTPDRHLDWDGCFNVRDLGGLRTADSRTTRWGAVVRSDMPDRLSAAGWSALTAYGIRTIVELRNHHERQPEVEAKAQAAGLRSCTCRWTIAPTPRSGTAGVASTAPRCSLGPSLTTSRSGAPPPSRRSPMPAPAAWRSTAPGS